MVKQGVVSAISRSELFSSLPAQEMEALAAQCGVRRLDKGSVVFQRGDEGDHLFVVGQGSVALTASTPEGGEVVFAVLYPPTSFGEMAVIDGGPRAAPPGAPPKTILVTVPGQAFRPLLARQPTMALSLMRAFSTIIRRLDDHAVDLVLMDLHGRVVKYLLLAARDTRPTPSGASFVPVDLRMTQTELGRLVGGSRQSVNRIIVELESAGAIMRVGTRIAAVRPDLLAAATNS